MLTAPGEHRLYLAGATGDLRCRWEINKAGRSQSRGARVFVWVARGVEHFEVHDDTGGEQASFAHACQLRPYRVMLDASDRASVGQV